MVKAHGHAAAIRSLQESETFDLGGMSPESITALIDAAFASPLDLSTHMIRITLVTGAGKQARQKYEEGASRCVTAALAKHGYLEDKAGGCDMASAGTYKLQHDTGKNLKTVVVFPKLSKSKMEESQVMPAETESLLPENSPGYKIAVSSLSVFQNLIVNSCPSWISKKGCLTCIEGIKELIVDMDNQLMKGQPLSSSEQSFYDSVASIDEKEAFVRQLAQTQIEKGDITSYEKQLLLQQNSDRISTLSSQNKSTQKALQRKELLQAIQPIATRKLTHHAKIGKLYKELNPLIKLEHDLKGQNLLSMKDATAMSRKQEIEEEIERLENASREWFEDDEAFSARVQACRDTFRTTIRSKKASALSSNTSGSTSACRRGNSATSKWVTPGAGTSAYGKKNKKSMGVTKGGNNLFGAMMNDSSSSEEEEEEEPAPVIAAVKPTSMQNKKTPNPVVAGPPTERKPEAVMKKNTKSKKKKSKQRTMPEQTDEELLDSIVKAKEEQAAAEQEAEDNQKTTVGKLVRFVRVYILPILAAIVAWVVRLFFGRPKKVKRG